MSELCPLMPRALGQERGAEPATKPSSAVASSMRRQSTASKCPLSCIKSGDGHVQCIQYHTHLHLQQALLTTKLNRVISNMRLVAFVLLVLAALCGTASHHPEIF